MIDMGIVVIMLLVFVVVPLALAILSANNHRRRAIEELEIIDRLRGKHIDNGDWFNG
jgi:hypothetical protein